MQSKEMKPQSIAAGVAEISGAGYEKMYQGQMEKKKKLGELYQKDLVSTLSNLHSYLGMDLEESVKGQDIFWSLTKAVMTGEYLTEAQDKILCLATEYGVEAEEDGFRRGFRTAMKLCMDSMGGGVCR